MEVESSEWIILSPKAEGKRTKDRELYTILLPSTTDWNTRIFLSNWIVEEEKVLFPLYKELLVSSEYPGEHTKHLAIYARRVEQTIFIG